jgi:hypothetical protein
VSVARHCIERATRKWARSLDRSACRAWRGALQPRHRHRHNGGVENRQRYGHKARGGVGNSHATNACKCWSPRGMQHRETALPCHVMAVRRPAAARRMGRKAYSAARWPTWSVRGVGSSSSFNTKQPPHCLPSCIDHITAAASYSSLPLSGWSKCGAHISRPSSGGDAHHRCEHSRSALLHHRHRIILQVHRALHHHRIVRWPTTTR